MPCLRLIVQTGQHQKAVEFDQDEILIGRSTDGDVPALILTDESVSRKHARIWRALDGFWIEDLCSTHGTKKKGVPLMGSERVFAGDHFELGDSLLTVKQADITEPDTDLDAIFDVHMSDGFGVGDDRADSSLAAQIRVVAHEEVFTPQTETETDERLGESRNWSWLGEEKSRLATQTNPSSIFGQLTEIFAHGDSLGSALEFAIKGIVNNMGPVERGAALLLNDDHTKLEICAHFPAFKPAFSSTLALSALTSGKAFIWKIDSGDITSASIKKLNIKSGLYAPLAFGTNQLGVLCVDSTSSKTQFTEVDLDFFINLSQVLGALIYCKQMVERKRLP